MSWSEMTIEKTIVKFVCTLPTRRHMPENKNNKINHPEGLKWITKKINWHRNVLKNKLINRFVVINSTWMIWYILWCYIWYVTYDTICQMICDIWYDMINDMMWYDVMINVIYDTIWYMIRYNMIYDMMWWYDIYDVIYDTIWYMIWCDKW